MWMQLLYYVITLALSIALAPKPPKPRAAAIDDFEFPTAEEGRPIPVIFGEIDVTGPNVLWYGGLQVRPIKKRSGFSKATIGYKYYIGFHIGLCHGEADLISRVAWGDKEAWTGSISANGSGTIDNVNLFGGQNRGGGVQGDFDIAFGGASQTANAYLESVVGETPPAFRGVVSFYWKGGYIGNSEFVKPLSIRVRRILQGWESTTWYSSKAVINTRLMNPAHIIYQCLTDTRWGMGIASTRINETNFAAIADQLYDEGFGLAMIWNQATGIEQFLQTVIDHIGGGMSFRLDSGQYELVLFRGGYDTDDLPEFTPSNVIALHKFEKKAWGETVNEVTVTYTDPDTLQPTTISAQDLASVEAQGARIPAPLDFKAIRDHTIAQQVLGRELAQRTMPLAKIEIEVNRDAWDLGFGGLFKFTWPDRRCEEKIFRALKVNKGTLQSNTIRVEAVEDIYQHSIEIGLDHQEATEDEAPPETPADDTSTGANVISATTTAPPSTPDDGDTYLVPAGATGAWSGHAGDSAEWDETEDAWIFTEVPDGEIVYVEDTATTVQVVGGVPSSFGGGTLTVDGNADISTLNFEGASVVESPAGTATVTIEGAVADLGDDAIIVAEARGSGIEELVGATTMTIVGDGVVTDVDPIVGDYSFDNNGTTAQGTDYVQFHGDATELLFAGDFTWEAWFKPGALVAEYMQLFGTDTISGGAGDFALQRGVSSSDLILVRWNGSSYVSILITSGNPFTVDTWHHVAVTREGTALRLFIDGVLEASATNSDTFGRAISSVTSFDVGRGINSDNADFNGEWQLLRVLNGLAAYTDTFSPPLTFFSSAFISVEAADARYAQLHASNTFDGTENVFESTVDLAGPLEASNAEGISGQVLSSQGPGLAPVWRTSSGGSIELGYNFSTTTTAADPGSQKLRFNNATLASVTAIYFDALAFTNFDANTILSLLVPGNRIYIQARADASKAVVYQVTATGTNNTGWWTIPVTHINSLAGGLFLNNADLVCVFIMSVSASLDAADNEIITGEWDFNNGLDIAADNEILSIGAGADLALYHDGSNSFIDNDTGDLIFLAGATQAARITSSANVLFGQDTTARTVTNQTPTVQLSRAAATTFSAIRWTNDTAGPIFQLAKSRGTTVGSYTALQAGDTLGEFRFGGSDGTDLATTTPGVFRFIAEGTIATGIIPTRFEVRTMNAAGSTTTGLALTSAQKFLLSATTTAQAYAGVTPDLQVNNALASIAAGRYSNDASGPSLVFTKSRSATVGTSTVVQSSDALGDIIFAPADGSDFASIAARIRGASDGASGTDDVPGRLEFSTTADGANSPTERLRIAANGAWGLAGANYGTSGQALVSNGSSAAPTWQTVSGGGSSTTTGALLYSQPSVAAGDTINTTAAETTFASKLSGFNASTLVAGDVIRFRYAGVWGTSGAGPTWRLKLKWGSTVLGDVGSGITFPASETNRSWVAYIDLIVITAGASGVVEVQGQVIFKYSAGDFNVPMINTATVTSVDLSATSDFNLTLTWGTSSASNTMTQRQAAIELLRAGSRLTPAVRETAISSSSAGSYAVSFGAAVAGDLFIIMIAGGFIATRPTGWVNVDLVPTTNWNGSIFCKRLTSADIAATSVTVTMGGTFNSVVCTACFNGAAGIREVPSGAVNRSTTGASSQVLEGCYHIGPNDYVLYFGSNRAASNDTVDVGTQLRQVNATNASGCLYGESAAGPKAPTFSYSTAGTQGHFEIVLAVFSDG